MKRIFIPLFLILLVLGGGGAGAWWFFGGKLPGAAETAGAQAQPAKPPIYVAISPLLIQRASFADRRQNVVIMLWLELPAEGGMEESVQAAMPRLRDAYLRALYEPALKSDSSGRVSATEIRRRVKAASAGVLGEGIVSNVLIRELQELDGGKINAGGKGG